MTTISAVLIAKNEEINIENCLKTVQWADEIIVVDSGSTDKTQEIARKFTTRIFDIPFTDFSDQKNTAVSKATGDWIFLIDADERVTPELEKEILSIIHSGQKPAVYAVHRPTFFFGKELRFSGVQDDYPIRLFPKGETVYKQPVHEEINTQLPVKKLAGHLTHYSTRDYAHYQSKLDCYIPLEKKLMNEMGVRSHCLLGISRCFIKFIFIYIWKFGFLDGWTGFQYARLSAYYAFLKYS